MKKQHGFSMLEVLVSMVIVMFGVLGVAGMQMMSITNTETARYKNVATVIASSLAAKMRSNVGYWLAPPTALISVNGSTVTGGPTAGANCSTAVCSASDMASYDLIAFGIAMAGGTSATPPNLTIVGLPGGQGTVQCTAAVLQTAALAPLPTICAITVSWVEKNVALNATSGVISSSTLATASNVTDSYTTMVSIPIPPPQ